MPLERGWSARTVYVQSLSKAPASQPQFEDPAVAQVSTGSAPDANDMFSTTAVIKARRRSRPPEYQESGERPRMIAYGGLTRRSSSSGHE